MASKDTGEALAREAEIMRKLGLQLTELKGMGLAELRARHVDLFGEEPRSKNLPFLRKKLAFRLQERVQGGLSPEARTRLEDLKPRVLPEKPARERKPSPRPPAPSPRDSRLPPVGTRLSRMHRGVIHEVEVLEEGFRYRDRNYRSLSAIAREISGTPWNGFTFFGLSKGTGHGK